MLKQAIALHRLRHRTLQGEVDELLSAKEVAEARVAEMHGKVLGGDMRARRAEDERDQERAGREALAAQLRQADKAARELQVRRAWDVSRGGSASPRPRFTAACIQPAESMHDHKSVTWAPVMVKEMHYCIRVVVLQH